MLHLTTGTEKRFKTHVTDHLCLVILVGLASYFANLKKVGPYNPVTSLNIIMMVMVMRMMMMMMMMMMMVMMIMMMMIMTLFQRIH